MKRLTTSLGPYGSHGAKLNWPSVVVFSYQQYLGFVLHQCELNDIHFLQFYSITKKLIQFVSQTNKVMISSSFATVGRI